MINVRMEILVFMVWNIGSIEKVEFY